MHESKIAITIQKTVLCSGLPRAKFKEMMITRAAITAVGGYVPDKILSNKDLEKMVDTNDQWIQRKNRYCRAPNPC